MDRWLVVAKPTQDRLREIYEAVINEKEVEGIKVTKTKGGLNRTYTKIDGVIYTCIQGNPDKVKNPKTMMFYAQMPHIGTFVAGYDGQQSFRGFEIRGGVTPGNDQEGNETLRVWALNPLADAAPAGEKEAVAATADGTNPF